MAETINPTIDGFGGSNPFARSGTGGTSSRETTESQVDRALANTGSSAQISTARILRNARNALTNTIEQARGAPARANQARLSASDAAWAAASKANAAVRLYAATIRKTKLGKAAEKFLKYFLIFVAVMLLVFSCILIGVFLTVARNPLQSGWIGVKYGACVGIEAITLGLANQDCEASACRDALDLFLDEYGLTDFRGIVDLNNACSGLDVV